MPTEADNPKMLGNLGDVVQLANNLSLIVGDQPGDIPNVIVYRADDRMYLLDSGAGPVMRASIVKVLQKAGPLQSFTLLNSHGHPDHVGNNDVIHEAQSKERHHYLSKAGLALLDPVPYFTDMFLKLSSYFDPLAAYRVNRFQWQLLSIIRNIVALFAGQRAGISAVFFLYMRKFQPFHPSRETIEFYESLPRKTFTIGGVKWTGWALSENDVWVLEERGHTPDGVIFYIPEFKLLHTGDLSLPIFPTFPDTNGEAVREVLGRYLSMASAGAVSLLTEGHFHQRIIRGQDEVTAFLEKILTEHNRFQAVLREILEEHAGQTVGEIYSSVCHRHNDPVVQHYLALEYPHHPFTLQQIIAVSLPQMGYLAQGQKGKQRFYRPASAAHNNKI